MSDPSRVRVSGPLEPYARGFAVELSCSGYAPVSAAAQLRLLAHLSRWLEGEGLDVAALAPAVVERFLDARRAGGYSSHRSARAVAPLLGYLRRLGAVPAPPGVVPGGPVERLLERYRHYLTLERGLTPATARGYVASARPFLRGRVSAAGLDLERLSAGEVTAFLAARCPAQARGPAKLTVTALRSLLGFLHLEGVLPTPLAAAVPAVASWRLSGLPRALEPGQVRSLLAACDRRSGVGLRDYAVLTLLARLGLRAGEVAALLLDDLDWRAGEIVVRGKGNRQERLPLPADVGEALVAYLRRGRPARVEDRSVFVRVLAPHRGLTASAVSMIVGGAARRAGLPPVHAHCLRHSAASEMLRARPARGGRAGPAPPSGGHHRDLRQGRSRRAADDRAALAGRCLVSRLREALADYLAVRRALGFKLARQEKLLAQFVDDLERRGQELVSVEHALAWATLPAGRSSTWWADRLSVVRGFAVHLHTLDPAHQVPPRGLLPPRPSRATPYLYSAQEIAVLIAATEILRFPHGRATYRTLIGLLATTGMRVGEAIGLDRSDLDSDRGVLVVRHGKFGKSRELPLHPSTVDALTRYLRRHDRPETASPSLFVSSTGSRLAYCAVQRTFRRLVETAGLGARSASCRPRLHDLRHSFAVGTLLDAYRGGADIDARLLLLSTYLGHVDPKATYWYLSAAPELLALAARRLEHHLGSRR